MLLGRISGLRGPDLDESCRRQVNPKHIGQTNQVDQHVRQFLPGPCMQRLNRRPPYSLVGRQSLEQFGQLADFAHQSEDQRLRIVKPRPVSFVGELPHAVPQLDQIRHAASMAHQQIVTIIDTV